MRSLHVVSFAAAMLFATQAHAQNAAKDEAQYRQAITLYEMGLKQAAYGIFAAIADRPTHTKFQETLGWLAKLAIDLPEPADVAERVGKYDEAHIAMFDNPAQREIHARLEWLSGQYAYRNRQYDEAIARYARVDRTSPLYGKAQMMSGMSHVLSRHAVPAVQSFERVIAWLDETQAAVPEAGRLRDLANISMARTYYSAALRVDENGTQIDAMKLSAAVKYYRRVSPAGEFYLDAIFEDAWARTMADDLVHALGDVRMVVSPENPPRFAEAALLEPLISYGACRFDDAQAALDRLRRTYEPRMRALTTTIDALAKAVDVEQFRMVASSPAVTTDRKLASYIAYDAYLEVEKKRFAQAPAAFKSSQVGNDVQDALALAQDIVRRQASDLGRERLLREKEELDSVLRDAKKIEIDIVAAKRNALESNTAAPPPPPPPPTRPRTATLSWPINGTAAPEPLYHAPITSACH